MNEIDKYIAELTTIRNMMDKGSDLITDASNKFYNSEYRIDKISDSLLFLHDAMVRRAELVSELITLIDNRINDMTAHGASEINNLMEKERE